MSNLIDRNSLFQEKMAESPRGNKEQKGSLLKGLRINLSKKRKDTVKPTTEDKDCSEYVEPPKEKKSPISKRLKNVDEESSSAYRDCKDEQILQFLENWREIYVEKMPSESDKLPLWLCEQFQLTPGVFTVKNVDHSINMILSEISHIANECVRRGLTGNASTQTINAQKKIELITKKLQHARVFLTAEAVLRCTPSVSDVSPEISVLLDASREQHYSDAELSSSQKLQLYLKAIAYHKNYRKLGESLFCEVVSSSGKGMHYWEEVCTIEEFIFRQCEDSAHFEHWKLLTDNSGNFRDVKNHLINDFSPQLPRLVPDRFWISWLNGIYSIERNTFYPYGHPDIPRGIVSHRLFKAPFDIDVIQAAKHPWDVTTPAFDTILSTQHLGADFPYLDAEGNSYYKKMGVPYYAKTESSTIIVDKSMEDVIKYVRADTGERLGYKNEQELLEDGWTITTNMNPLRILYTMMGRMLYPIHTPDDKEGFIDNMQKVLFILGKAGTGKSIISSVIRSWFNPREVGVLNSNCEEQWALSNLYDKMIWMCPEVRANFRLDVAQFQSMVVGEPTTVNVKQKTPDDVMWDSNGLLLGNELPRKWTDGQGSITRRVILFRFLEVPDRVDPTLQDRIMAEMSRIIYKCNSIYIETRDYIREKSTPQSPFTIDTMLSPYFKNTNDHLANETNTLLKFLRQYSQLKFGDPMKHYCKLKSLVEHYHMYCKENSYRPRPFNEEFYDVPFRAKKLKVKSAYLAVPGENSGIKQNCKWVFGVSIEEDGADRSSSTIFYKMSDTQ